MRANESWLRQLALGVPTPTRTLTRTLTLALLLALALALTLLLSPSPKPNPNHDALQALLEMQIATKPTMKDGTPYRGTQQMCAHTSRLIELPCISPGGRHALPGHGADARCALITQTRTLP